MTGLKAHPPLRSGISILQTNYTQVSVAYFKKATIGIAVGFLVPITPEYDAIIASKDCAAVLQLVWEDEARMTLWQAGKMVESMAECTLEGGFQPRKIKAGNGLLGGHPVRTRFCEPENRTATARQISP